MSAIRVLALTGAYAPEFSSGGLQVQAVAARLRGRATVRVLTTAIDARLPRRDTIDGIDVWRVPGGAAGKSPAAIMAMLRALLSLVRQSDVVHIQGVSAKNIPAVAVSRLLARPVMVHLQTSRHDEPASIRAQGALAWWAYRSADAYVAVSPGLLAHHAAAGLGNGTARQIPNGVDAARFRPASAAERQALRRDLQLPLEGPIVLFVGVLSRDKQPDVLYEAWAEIQRQAADRSTLVFVGATNPSLFELGDRLSDRVQAAAEASGLSPRLRFVPPTPRIEDYFRAADVFAMPSAREGLPIVLLEAMACGLPCVASLLPGSTDTIVRDGVNGRLVPPGGRAALARALDELLAAPAEAARRGAAARRTVEERYTIEAVAEQWLRAYRDVLSRQ